VQTWKRGRREKRHAILTGGAQKKEASSLKKEKETDQRKSINNTTEDEKKVTCTTWGAFQLILDPETFLWLREEGRGCSRKESSYPSLEGKSSGEDTDLQ